MQRNHGDDSRRGIKDRTHGEESEREIRDRNQEEESWIIRVVLP